MSAHNFWRTLTATIALVTLTALTSTHAVAAPTPANGPEAGGTKVTLDNATIRFTQVSAKVDHTTALASNGRAYAWGNIRGYGPLGNGETGGSLVPVAVTMPKGVTFKQISAGGHHDMAIGSDKKIYVWGAGDFGQLGQGNTEDQLVPVALPGATTFSQISAGIDYSLAISTDGKLYAWGNNSRGELGIGSTTATSTPTLVSTPPGVTFKQISAGDSHSLAISTDGKTYAWGDNTMGQLGVGNTAETLVPQVVQVPTGVTFATVSAGVVHSLATDTAGNAYAWGDGREGQLGHATLRSSLVPIQVATPVPFTSVTTGDYFSLALGSDGNSYSWGANWSGELGDGTNKATLTPVRVQTPQGAVFTQLAAGEGHSIALSSTGATYAWGQSMAGELGTGWEMMASLPTKVRTPKGVTFTRVDTGIGFSLAQGSDKSSYAWGDNMWGQLGDGTTRPSPVPVRVQTPANVTFTTIFAGWTHTVAIGSDGNTYAWGEGTHGQLGNDSNENSSVPVRVITPPGVTFKQIGAGWTHSVAIGSDGKTYAWGLNRSGELGNGTTTDSWRPTEVKTPPGVRFTQIFGGQDSTVAIGTDGKTYAWGSNVRGQLGNGTRTQSIVPFPVILPDKVRFTRVNTFENHVLALGDDGKLYAWGANDHGQLGNGNTYDSSVPAPVTMITGSAFTTFAAGSSFSLALGSDGETYSWGDNKYGQLGDGTYIEEASPVTVMLPAGVQTSQVAAGGGHSLAVGTDGNTYAWGENTNGELGIAAPVYTNIPALSAHFELESVTFDDAYADILQSTSTAVVVTSPPGSGSKVPVVVTSRLFGGTTATAIQLGRNFEYTYDSTTTVPPARTERVAGDSRYATSLAVNKKTMITGSPVFVTTGATFADALSVGPAVKAHRGSLVLTKPGRMDQTMVNLITAKKPRIIYVIGSTGAVSSTVEKQLKGIAPIKRVGGATRYETSATILTTFFSEKVVTTAFVATGQNYPDALSAAAVGGALGAPVLLVNGKSATTLHKDMRKTLTRLAVRNLIVVGGKNVVSDSLVRNLRESFTVRRVSGTDRYATNLAVNNLLTTTPRGVWIVTGTNFPDALSAAVPAGITSQRLVLAPRGCVPAGPLGKWITGKTTRITLVGGNAVLSPTVAQLQSCG